LADESASGTGAENAATSRAVSRHSNRQRKKIEPGGVPMREDLDRVGS
jgi:hypothetical protein